MELASVRDLKQELYEPLLAGGGLQAQQVMAVSLPAERTADVPSIQPGIALGISAGERAGDYRLAIRIQHRDLIGSSKLTAIERAANHEVDVEYIGELTKLQSASSVVHRQRPVRPGISVGHYDITAGTLGALVRVAESERPRILSNNHVLADENRGAAGDEILHPGAVDGGQSGADRIASLERFVALNPKGINHVDAALAVFEEGIEFDPTIDGIMTTTDIAPPEEVLNVVKRGRTTGITQGAVTAIEVDNVVVRFSTGVMRFDNQVEIASPEAGGFSRGGDSGSLVVDLDTGNPVGLLFAGGDQGGPHGTGLTYANPLAAVFQQLAVSGLW